MDILIDTLNLPQYGLFMYKTKDYNNNNNDITPVQKYKDLCLNDDHMTIDFDNFGL